MTAARPAPRGPAGTRAVPRVDGTAGSASIAATKGRDVLALWIDFDGTLVVPNVAMVLVERFGADGKAVAQEGDRLLHEGRITLREAWEREVALLPPDRVEEMVEYACRHAPLRPGARDLIDLVDRHRVSATVISGGVDFYIRPILERQRVRWPVLSDVLVRDERGHLGVRHPHGHATCRLCGICKAQAVRSDPARTSVFVGDGSTDRYAAEVADVVFARGRLRTYCEERRIPYLPFEDLTPVVRWLGSALSEGSDQIDPRRLGRADSPCPISRDLAERASPRGRLGPA